MNIHIAADAEAGFKGGKGAVMNWLDTCRRLAQATRERTLRYIDGLQEPELRWLPRHDANPILWILWHIGEYEEKLLWTYYNQAPIYRFGMSCKDCNLQDMPARDAILDYLESTRQAFWAFLDQLDERQLQAPVPSAIAADTPLYEFIFQSIYHEMHHAGQIAYIRRLMGKPVSSI